MFSSELTLPSSLCCVCCLLHPHTEGRPIRPVLLHQRRSLYDADVLHVCVFRCPETRAVLLRVAPLACPPPTTHCEKFQTVHCVKDNIDNVLYILTCDALDVPTEPTTTFVYEYRCVVGGRFYESHYFLQPDRSACRRLICRILKNRTFPQATRFESFSPSRSQPLLYSKLFDSTFTRLS